VKSEDQPPRDAFNLKSERFGKSSLAERPSMLLDCRVERGLAKAQLSTRLLLVCHARLATATSGHWVRGRKGENKHAALPAYLSFLPLPVDLKTLPISAIHTPTFPAHTDRTHDSRSDSRLQHAALLVVSVASVALLARAVALMSWILGPLSVLLVLLVLLVLF